MPKKRHKTEEIINHLRQVEVLMTKGQTLPEAARQIGVTEQTIARWRKEYGGLRVDQAKRLKEVEQENLRLRRIVADLTLDKAMLKEIAQGNF